MQRCLGVDGAGHTAAGQRCGLLVEGNRCEACSRARSRTTTRAKRERRPYTRAEQTRRAATVRDWIAEHGPLCPGWRRLAHYVDASQLTADHPHAVAAGGHETQAHAVLCRGCNSAKGSKV